MSNIDVVTKKLLEGLRLFLKDAPMRHYTGTCRGAVNFAACNCPEEVQCRIDAERDALTAKFARLMTGDQPGWPSDIQVREIPGTLLPAQYDFVLATG